MSQERKDQSQIQQQATPEVALVPASSVESTLRRGRHMFEATPGAAIAIAREALDQAIANPQKIDLGQLHVKDTIESSIGPFSRLPEYKTQYPQAVTEALGDLYQEYNRQFAPLVEANREWDTDYQYCLTGPDGTPVNYFVQIDMVGLPDDFLEQAAGMSRDEVKEVLRGRIFEFENSLAMYQLLQEIFSEPEQDSRFKQGFRASMDALRQRFGKKIAILAVTDEKYQGVKSSEFGKEADEPLHDADVMRLSGFDRLFGPEEFKQYLAENNGECDYLLVVRSSDPMSKLRNPKAAVSVPLMEDPETRRIIKAHSLTLNLDAPDMHPDHRINDTKAYLHPMGMAFEIGAYEDLDSPEFREHLSSHGVDPQTPVNEVRLRAKPLKGTYGCYGHASGPMKDGDFRHDLKKGLKDRGRYVVQIERDTPVLHNESEGRAYTYIDRNFMTIYHGQPVFLSGFRSLMPVESTEAKKRRIHGNSSTVWAEIS